MRTVCRALAVLGLAVSIVGCSNMDRPDLRSEFGLPRATHFSSYHHCTHHWHGVCCTEAGHEGCDECEGTCDTPHAHATSTTGCEDHPCHFCGEEHSRNAFGDR